MSSIKKGKYFSWIISPVLILLWLLLKLGTAGISFISLLFSTAKKSFKDLTIIFKSSPEIPGPLETPTPIPKKTVRSKKRRGGFFKFFKYLRIIYSKKVRLTVISLLSLVGFIYYSYFLVSISHDLPSPVNLKTLPTPSATEFYDRNNILLYRFYEGKNRTPVKISEIPQSLIDATIAAEDKNFYSHFGVDFYGIVRAVLTLIRDGEVQGGSTITQQLIKNTLLTPERTINRKLREIVLSFWAERIYSKNEILEMYFNEVPYGGSVWGIGAASKTIFGKDVANLTLAESSFLAGLPASPTAYSPYGNNPDLSKKRQRETLHRMVEDGFITQPEADEAFSKELHIKPQVTEIRAPHFVMYVRNKLSEKYGERFISQGGLKVYTSLDLTLQETAEEIVLEELEKIKNLKVSNAAAMITKSDTGEILAMVGSRNFWDERDGNFNVATALRQPGSSIKPVTYAAALRLGYSPGNILLDTPVSFKSFWETYTPVNYDGKFRGPVTIRNSLAQSLNIPAVKMLAVIGVPEMLKTAKDLGIKTLTDRDRYGLSLTLGGGEVRMTDMMTVYGTLSQMGKKHELQEIIKITDNKGNIIEDNSNVPGENAIEPSVAYLITDILSDNKARAPVFGSNSLLNIPGFQVAVKTGTTDSKRDNWTFGFTPEYVTGVWVGNNDNTPMDQKLSSGVTGAAPIWNRIMTEVLKNGSITAFERPGGIIEGTVDGHRDLVIAGMQRKSVIGANVKKVKEENSDKEKDVITFTDPFSTYQSDQSGQPIQINP